MNGNDLAVVINGNALKAEDPYVSNLGPLCEPHGVAVHTTHTLEELEFTVGDLLRNGHRVIANVGGDGAQTELCNLIERYGRGKRVLTAALKGGTGNGLSSVVGQKNPYIQMKQLLAAEVDDLPVLELPLIKFTYVDLEGNSQVQHGYIGGVGWDAMLLADYACGDLKGIEGYLVASLLKSTPKEIRRNAKVIGQMRSKGKAFSVDYEQKVPFLADEREFDGQINSVIVGTMPYGGFSFKVFPESVRAQKIGTFQMRIVSGKPQNSLLNLVNNAIGAWRGVYHPTFVHDYLGEDMTVSFEKPREAQIGGSSIGEIVEMRVEYSKSRLHLVDFTQSFASLNPHH